MHNIFLSYAYRHDAARAKLVRSVWLAQGGAATLESTLARSDTEVKRWIDRHLETAKATVVLIGTHTGASKWVRYEIQRSKNLGMGLLGIDITGMRGSRVGRHCSPMPTLAGYRQYDWVRDNGERNLGQWIAAAIGDATTDQSVSRPHATASRTQGVFATSS